MKKKQTILIPVNIDPPIRCYRIHAYLINIIGNAYPDFSLYIISNYLSLHNGDERWRREYLDFHLDNNFINVSDLFLDNSWFDVVQIDFSASSKLLDSEVKEQIIFYLKKGYYVLHRVNECALPHANVYQQKDSENNAMTFGYVYDEDSFIVLDYDKDGRFGSSFVCCKDYMNSLYTVNSEYFLKLNFIKAKPGLSFAFNEERARKLLSCYINCENAYPDNPYYVNNIFGYDGVERALKEMEKGVNMIRLRVIKEHKEIILRYMEYVTTHHLIDSDYFLNEYREIKNKMNIVFMKILKKKFGFGQSETEYNLEYDEIRRINERESGLLYQFLK